jgi:hypothetical protein
MTRSEYYHRERGAVCYSLPLFVASERPYRRVTDAFREAILTPNLEWCWRSSVRTPPAPDTHSTSAIGRRPLVPLSAETFDQFVADVQYIDEWDNGKDIELFAYDAGTASLIIDEYDHGLRTALADFAAYEGGPLRLVIITPDDEENSLVFVPRAPIPSVEKLLERWDAPQARESGQRKYGDLRIVKLETIYSLPLIHD